MGLVWTDIDIPKDTDRAFLDSTSPSVLAAMSDAGTNRLAQFQVAKMLPAGDRVVDVLEPGKVLVRDEAGGKDLVTEARRGPGDAVLLTDRALVLLGVKPGLHLHYRTCTVGLTSLGAPSALDKDRFEVPLSGGGAVEFRLYHRWRPEPKELRFYQSLTDAIAQAVS